MKHLTLTPTLYEYMLSVSLQEDYHLKALREETAKLSLASMQIPPEQAQFFQFLIRMLQAKKVLEVGTFTGYSALAMAQALPDDGQLITCDISEEWTSKAHPFWKAAQQEHKIQLRLAPAIDSLNQILKEQGPEYFDFIFIDADKTNYVPYYELSLQLIKPKGIIVIDNIFWGGDVIDKDNHDAQTREIRKLNALIKDDERVYTSLLPIADGIFLVQLK